MSTDVFAAYEALRARVTRESAELFERYAAHLQCRRGCYYCCDDIAVLPIEFEALRRAVSGTGISSSAGSGGPPETDRRRCGFLGPEGECTVYAARPVICRTHGLPLAYRLYEYDEHGRAVSGSAYMDSWCDLNFTGLGDESAAAYFDGHGRINQARLNETLEELNRRFLASPDGVRYRGRDWIRLSELVGDQAAHYT
jgi:Fe-S-cluster containining protein